MTESRMQGFAAGRYAAIDIGTVTCRMLVADVDDVDALVHAAVVDVDDVPAAEGEDHVDALGLERLGDEVPARDPIRIAAARFEYRGRSRRLRGCRGRLRRRDGLCSRGGFCRRG